MTKKRTYLSHLLLGFTALDDVEAERTAESLAALVDDHLDPGDTIRVTQTHAVGDPVRNEEAILRMKLGRNELLRTPYRDAHTIALEMDKMIWKLEKMITDDDPDIADYDFNRTLVIAEALRKGKNPLD